MLGCVTPCWVKQERDPYNLLVPIDYQAVSGNGGVLPTGCPEPAVPCPILPGGGGWGRDWRAQCERGKHTLGTQVSHTHSMSHTTGSAWK